MAKQRKQVDLSTKLGGDQPAGWRDHLGPALPVVVEPAATPVRIATYKRKTYLITADLEERVQQLADRERVGQNELVRYLLQWALDQVERGAHQLPVTPVEKRTLSV